MSIPSDLIFPSFKSSKPSKQLINVVFPEPDGPTKPIFSPFLISKLIFLKTGLVSLS